MSEMTEARLMTTGLHCRSCSMLVDMTVGDLDGVESASTDHTTGATDIRFDADAVKLADIVAAIRSVGYDVDES